jgi:hypothetical protein
MVRYALVFALTALGASPAAAGAGSFALINGTPGDLGGVSIRRHGIEDWKNLSVAPKAGARASVDFNDPDCAFDVRADLGGGKTAVWPGVNLCETKAVTLKRDESGAVWVDYD